MELRKLRKLLLLQQRIKKLFFIQVLVCPLSVRPLQKGVKWPNSLSIPVEVYAGLLKNVHDGKIADLKNKKPLSDKELVMGAEQQILLRAMATCPEFVPEDVQKQVKSAFEKMKKK